MKRWAVKTGEFWNSKIEETGDPRENPKNPDTAQNNCPLAKRKLKLGIAVGTNERSNLLYPGMSQNAVTSVVWDAREISIILLTVVWDG